MVHEHKTRVAKSEGFIISPATQAALKRFGAAFKRKGEMSAIKTTIRQLQQAPRSKWNGIIRNGSGKFFNPKQREAARKILSSTVYEASVRFYTADKNGRPVNIRTELRLPNWTYEDGQLAKLRSNLKAGLTIRDALRASGIKPGQVKTYRIYQNGRRRQASLDLVATKDIPARGSDLRISINNPKTKPRARVALQ